MTESPAVIPTLRYRDAHAAVAWLGKVFGFTPTMVIPGDGDTVAHAELTYRSAVIMLGSTTDGADGRVPYEQGPSAVYLVVDGDMDEHYAAALAAGAEVVEPLAEKGYGGKGYTVLDPERNVWSLGTYRPALEPDEATAAR